jgi:hypothetical protein
MSNFDDPESHVTRRYSETIRDRESKIGVLVGFRVFLGSIEKILKNWQRGILSFFFANTSRMGERSYTGKVPGYININSA